MRRETEQAKIDLQATRLGLVNDAKLPGEVLQVGMFHLHRRSLLML